MAAEDRAAAAAVIPANRAAETDADALVAVAGANPAVVNARRNRREVRRDLSSLPHIVGLMYKVTLHPFGSGCR